MPDLYPDPASLRPQPTALPPDAGIADLYPQADLADAFQIALPATATRDPEALARFVWANQAPWVGRLMHLRDLLVAAFGLKTSQQLAQGDGGGTHARIGIFKVYAVAQREIVMGEDDTHLDFRVSMLLRPAAGPGPGAAVLVTTTVVHCHNLLGRAYIGLIRPFHRMVVRSGLRRAAQRGWPAA